MVSINPRKIPPIILLFLISAALSFAGENKKDSVAMTELGKTYLEKGDRVKALNTFSRAVKIDPDYPMAHFFLGKLRYLMRDYDNAISEFNIFKEKMKPILTANKENVRTYIGCLYYMGEAYFTLERYDDSRVEIEEILKIDPKEQNAYYNLGVYYYAHEHNRSRAYNFFMKTINIAPGTDIAKNAKYAIEFIRNNPDSRIAPDFSFINKEYKD